jgi:hypothetical protein
MKYVNRRPFNKDVYNKYDLKCKETLVEIMKVKGFELQGDITEENYKKYDLLFYNASLNKYLSFENEVRHNFDQIREEFSTIHIPIRKKNTQANYYVVWNPDLNQVIVIDRKIIQESINQVTEVLCRGENTESGKIAYHEEFINVPKEKCKYFFIGQGYKMIEGEFPEQQIY